jgi:hypothetical protein
VLVSLNYPRDVINIGVNLHPNTITMKTTFLAQALALVAPSQAYLRFGCATLSVQRLDPLVEPGAVPSAHLHQIIGGNGFNATMDPKTDVAERATCTTCTFSEDFSNYWTAVMYLVCISSLNTSLSLLTFSQYVKSIFIGVHVQREDKTWLDERYLHILVRLATARTSACPNTRTLYSVTSRVA